MMQNSFFLLLFVLLLSIPSLSQTVVRNVEKQVEVTLKAEKETIMVDEPTLLFFEIKNNSSECLCFGAGGDYRNWLGRPNRFSVTITGITGKPVPPIEAPDGGGFISCYLVPANSSYTQILHLTDWANLQEPGHYTVNVKRKLYFFTDKKTSKIFPDPDFVFDANLSTKIEVVPTDKNKMGQVIDSLGKAMLDGDYHEAHSSAHALASINDERVISFFSAALLKYVNNDFPSFSNDRAIFQIAATALSRFNNDEAINGLKAAMKNPDKHLRFDVATALYCNNHPQAFDLLLSMKTDSYDGVRLRVAQALSRTKSEKNLELVREMLEKEDELFKQSANGSIVCRFP